MRAACESFGLGFSSSTAAQVALALAAAAAPAAQRCYNIIFVLRGYIGDGGGARVFPYPDCPPSICWAISLPPGSSHSGQILLLQGVGSERLMRHISVEADSVTRIRFGLNGGFILYSEGQMAAFAIFIAPPRGSEEVEYECRSLLV